MTVSGQPTVSYNYDAASRLTGVQQGGQAVALNYDATGRRTQLTLPNEVTTAYTYDPASRLQQILHQKAGNPLENIQYQYDATRNRTNYSRTQPHASIPSEFNATFDAANRMLTLNDTVFAYDLNGNLINETSPTGVKGYTWDTRNRLTNISGPGLSAAFKYDAFDRRIEKTINGITTQYLYDGWDVAAEFQNGQMTATYLRGLSVDEPFTRTKGGSTVSYLQDALGSIVGLSDSTGALVTTYSYDAFGIVSESGFPTDQPYKYTGRDDDRTGLYYYRSRYYSPTMRRFISEDPIGLWGDSENFYAYVGNNPVRFIDPYGLAGKPKPPKPPDKPEKPQPPPGHTEDPGRPPNIPQRPERINCGTFYRLCIAAAIACPSVPGKIGLAALCTAAYIACVFGGGGDGGD